MDGEGMSEIFLLAGEIVGYGGVGLRKPGAKGKDGGLLISTN